MPRPSTRLWPRILIQTGLCLLLLFLFSAPGWGGQQLLPTARAEEPCAEQDGPEFLRVSITERRYAGAWALAVSTNTRLDPQVRYDRYLAVFLRDSGKMPDGWVLAEDETTLYYPHIQPESTYSVTVYPGFPTQAGHKLTSTISKTLTTRKVPPAVGFASSGSILPGELSKGLPVRAVNIEAVDVDFFRINSDNMPRFLSQWYASGKQSIYSINRWRRFAHLVYSGRYHFDLPDNTQRTVYLPVQDRPELGRPGLYAAVLQESGTYDYQLNTTIFQVSDLGLHVRHYRDRTLAFASSLSTAQPVPGVRIRLLNQQGEELQQAFTRENGLAQIRRNADQASLLLASRGRDLAVLSLNAPSLDLSEFPMGRRNFKAQELFFYGPRDIYRPGEEVRISALLRDYDGRLLRGLPLQARLKRPDGRQVREWIWTPETLGWYTRAFTLPESAQTGIWKLEVITPDQAVHQTSLHVADFLPERLSIHFEQPETFIPPEQPIQLPVRAEYLYGAPVSGNEVRTTVQVLAAARPLDALPGFVFGRAEDRGYSRFFELNPRTLDQEGRACFSIPPKWSDLPSPLEITATVRVFESGGRPVARSQQFTTWPREIMIGIRPEFMDNTGQGRAKSNSLASFEIVAVDQTGSRQSAENLLLRLIHEQRDYYWEETNSGWSRDFVSNDLLVKEQRLSSGPFKRTRVSLPVKWGHYRLEVQNLETGQLSSLAFEAGFPWMGGQDQPNGLRPDRITLKLDQKAYRPGETITLSILPPYAGSGFVCVESDRLLWKQSIQLEATGTDLEIPVDPNWDRHDLYISAVLIRPALESPSRRPKRCIGLLHLPLERDQRRLDVSIEAPAEIHPETTLNCRVKVSNQQGQIPEGPVVLTLAASDVGVLNLTDFQTPDPFSFFFSPRSYVPEMQDVFDRVIEQGEGPLAQLVFGGDADLSRGGPEPGTEVSIVSLFSGPIDLASDGTADIKLQVPDFNGRLRLMALAFSAYCLGSADTETRVAAPVTTTLSRPRFLAAGDQSNLSLELHNVSPVLQEVRFDLTPTRLLDMQPVQTSISLKPNEKWQTLFPIKAHKHFGQAAFRLRLAATAPDQASYRLDRSWTLGIRPAYPALHRFKRAALSSGQSLSFPLDDPEALLPAGTQAQLLISDQPPIDLRSHLESLISYPYGCLEQQVSRALPLIFASPENLRKWDIQLEPDLNRVQALEATFSKLAGLQLANGGFAMWEANGPEAYWLTAYTADFLLTARDYGFQPPESLISSCLKRLVDYVRSPEGLYHEPGSLHPAHSSLAYKCYAGYVLSRVRQASLSGLRLLLDHQGAEARSQLPLIHLGLALKNQGDHRRAEQAIAQGLAIERPERSWLGDYGSRIRDLAEGLHLLLENGYTLSRQQDLLYTLSDALHSRTWLSTQERASLFQLGLSLERQTGQSPWSAEYAVGDEVSSVSAYGTFRKHFDFSQLRQGLLVHNPKSRTLFVRFQLLGYPVAPPEPVHEQLRIKRSYYDLQGQPLVPDSLEVGQLLVVHLQLQADRVLPDVLVADLLPAGLELEDQTLKHAIPVGDIRIDGHPVRDWLSPNALSYQGFRDDRYLAAVKLSPRAPLDLFYLLQAVTPGRYAVPPPYAESMYLPDFRSIGQSLEKLQVVNERAQEQENKIPDPQGGTN